MIVKPAEAGGAELPAPTDGPAPDADDDADAVDALTGVGHDLPSGGGEAAAPGREVDADAATARGGAAADDAPARPTATPAEDDESAKMLMLLGELGGADDSSAEEEEEEEEEERGAGARRGSGKKETARRAGVSGGSARGGGGKSRNANDGAGVSNVTNDDPNEHAGGSLVQRDGQSGPVGEWLKAEGEARMKMADHRRLIYRWTNAVYRLLGMKIPRGMGSLFDKGEKNKREKFDRFLSYYYGTETFEPGTYWYNNADTIQFFVELIRVATRDRYVPSPSTVQRLFRKKDPTRQASTWIMVAEELEKTDVTADELRALFEGEPRVVDGFPRGRPLFVPVPKNPKGHHKYTRGDFVGGGVHGGSGPASPQPSARNAERGTRAGAARANGGGGKKGGARAGGAERAGAGAGASPAAHSAAAAAAAAQAMAAFGAAGAAAQQHAAAFAQSHHAALLGSLGQLGAQFGLTEAQMGRLGQFSGLVGSFAGTPGALHTGAVSVPVPVPNLDPSSAAAMRLAHRRATVASLMAKARGFTLGGAYGQTVAADFSAVAERAREAAAAAPGACERVTLAPSPVRRETDREPHFSRLGSNKKRSGSKLESTAHAPVRRLDAANSRDEDLTPRRKNRDVKTTIASLPPPTRLVGDVLLGALGDVLGGVFGLVVRFDETHETLTPADAADAGRERLMNLGEEVHNALPLTTAPSSVRGDGGGDESGVRGVTVSGGRSTREPVADRTALGAEVDSVLVAARAAESAWKRHADAFARAAEAEAEADHARRALLDASDAFEGARMARDALENDGGVSVMSGDVRVDGFVSVYDLSVRAATLAAVQARVDDSESSKSVKEERLRVKEADAENARRECHSFERTFKPAYEEVRKRALRLRLAAEERCERQIARVLSRAERDVAAWRAVVKKEEKQEKDAEGKSPGKTETSAAVASLLDAESALRVIKRALDGCKSATEWSKSEIATISSGRDV